ncbi:MAG: rod shape-determining protein MreD [Phycisphaerae bacterium]|jgi:rod shape-determining protein MreD
MHWLRFVALLLVSTLLQADLLNSIAVASIKPNLLLILLVFFAIFCEPYDAIIASFAIGFAADLIGQSMGPMTLSFGLLGTSLCYLSKAISLRRMPFQAAAIFLIGFMTALFAYLLSGLQEQPAYQNTLGVLFATPLYSGVVGPFLFLPLAWWMQIKIQRTGRGRRR